MVDKFKGVIEIEIAGAKRGFKFGLRSMQLFSEMVKVKFSEVNKVLVEASGNNGQDESSVNIDVIMKFYLCAAIAYARLNKQPEPTIDDIYNWIEEVTMDVMTEELKKISDLPNQMAPQMMGPN